jgi:hypothetical protein
MIGYLPRVSVEVEKCADALRYVNQGIEPAWSYPQQQARLSGVRGYFDKPG